LNTKNQKKIYLVIKIILSFSLLLFLFRIKLNVQDLWLILQKARFTLLLLSLLPTIIIVLIKTWKWQLMVTDTFKCPLRFKESLFSYLFGLAPGLLTPGRIGEILRITLISKLSKVKLGELFVIDKYIELSTLFLAGALGSYLMKLDTIFRLALFSFVLCMLLFVVRKKWVPPLLGFVSRTFHVHLRIEFQDILFGRFLLYVMLSAIALFLDIFTFYLIVNSFQDFHFAEALIIFPLLLLAAVMPISISGLGVRETAAIYLMSLFAVSPEISFNASLLIFVIGSVLPALAGQFLFLFFRNQE